MNADIEPADRFPVDATVENASAADYDGLLLPGGAVNPDNLRTNQHALDFVCGLFDADKPVAAICHAPWTLVEAGLIEGRTLTSYPSIRTDIRNAVGIVVDQGGSGRRQSRHQPRPGRPARVLRQGRRAVRPLTLGDVAGSSRAQPAAKSVPPPRSGSRVAS